MDDTSFLMEDTEANLEEMVLHISGFAEVPHLLHPLSADQYRTMREGLAHVERIALLNGFIKAFLGEDRKKAFALSEALTARGVPPCFREIENIKTELTLNQKFDLFLYDVRWLRNRYQHHESSIIYQRYKTLFQHHEGKFHNEAKFIFYEGKRPAWKIVGSMHLTEQQQHDCVWLKSAPIKKRHAGIILRGKQVKLALSEELRNIRTTKNITGDTIRAAIARRYAIWLCSQSTKGSPTETAKRYFQMTGEEVTRQVVADQLEKIKKTLLKSGMKTRAESEPLDV